MSEVAPAPARQALWMTDAQLSGLLDDIEENLKSGVLTPARLACGPAPGHASGADPL
jgi:hypothetical protein